MLANSETVSSPVDLPRDSYLNQLLAQCESELEREWLNHLYKAGLRLPDQSQIYIEECQTRPDFIYNKDSVYAAIYVDGSHHDSVNRQQRDSQQTECIEDQGYQVIRFGYRDDWAAIFQRNQHIFGGGV